MQWCKDDDYSTWKKIHRGAENNMDLCWRKGLQYIPRIIMSQTESAWTFQAKTVSYFHVLCFDNQQKRGAVSKHGHICSIINNVKKGHAAHNFQ
jgi:hypothetical protein